MNDSLKTDDPLKTLLLVTDDEDLREVAHIVLERPGLHLLDAHNSVMALRLAKEMLPHLMLLDAALPGIREFEIVQALRDDEETTDIRIVLLADADQDTAVAGQTGVDHYLLKPFDPPVLATTIEEILGPFYDVVPWVH